ncbi:MAG: DUF2794 domain-containing protein [Proteobacteria bacterium]|nr:DUF2794 domain-containing protein [Pseudomonadota bacterium]
MAEEPIAFLRAGSRSPARTASWSGYAGTAYAAAAVRFDRLELNRILTIYGRMVAAGEWRDYALDFLEERAAFSIFRRTSEVPLYTVEKRPKLKTKQGQYAVIDASGHVLKRGHELENVLRIFERKLIKALAAE